jgi:hypothetical protein
MFSSKDELSVVNEFNKPFLVFSTPNDVVPDNISVGLRDILNSDNLVGSFGHNVVKVISLSEMPVEFVIGWVTWDMS